MNPFSGKQFFLLLAILTSAFYLTTINKTSAEENDCTYDVDCSKNEYCNKGKCIEYLLNKDSRKQDYGRRPICGDAIAPACDGDCNPGELCVPSAATAGCQCVPTPAPAVIPCSQSYPACNGACPSGTMCIYAGMICQCGNIIGPPIVVSSTPTPISTPTPTSTPPSATPIPTPASTPSSTPSASSRCRIDGNMCVGQGPNGEACVRIYSPNQTGYTSTVGIPYDITTFNLQIKCGWFTIAPLAGQPITTIPTSFNATNLDRPDNLWTVWELQQLSGTSIPLRVRSPKNSQPSGTVVSYYFPCGFSSPQQETEGDLQNCISTNPRYYGFNGVNRTTSSANNTVVSNCARVSFYQSPATSAEVTNRCGWTGLLPDSNDRRSRIKPKQYNKKIKTSKQL